METLYHYCNTNAFVASLTSRTIWLSSLTMSNDSMEGKVISDAFKRVIDREGIDSESAAQMHSIVESFGRVMDGLGFCLSEKGDLLSQWRGYAANGKGFSIGYSKAYLDALAKAQDPKTPGFRLNKVLYKPEDQDAVVAYAFNEIRDEIASGKLKAPRPPGLLTGFGDPSAQEKYKRALSSHLREQQKLFVKLISSLPNFYALKGQAFEEEHEWRLVSFLIKGEKDECKFRAAENRLIPYREFFLKELEIPAISEIVIGPCNETPEFVVNKLLNQNGFENVLVRRSSATYR